MNRSKIIQPRYDVTIYDGHAITMRTMTREQVLAINPQSVDHFLSSALGIWGFRTADGEWIEHRGGDWPGLGDAGIRIIQAIQINYGDFLTPSEIADLTGYPTLQRRLCLVSPAAGPPQMPQGEPQTPLLPEPQSRRLRDRVQP